MARSLQARAAARGFPVFDVSGQSGQGALPDSTAPPARAGLPVSTWTDPDQDPGWTPVPQPPPEEYVLGLSLWGLPGAFNPDNTPRTHAAPMADPTLPAGEYYAEADATHGPVFTGPEVRRDVGTKLIRRLEHSVAEGAGPSNLQPLTGQIRSNAGFDGVQGYGGGGDGPRGTNATMPIVTENKDYPGETYNDVFVSAAEVPFLVAEADQFIAREPALPAWSGGGFDVPSANVRAQDAVSADVPAQGPPLSSAVPAFAASFWG